MVKARYVALVAAPLFLTLTLVLNLILPHGQLPTNLVFEPPFPYSVLHTLILAVTSVFVASISAKSYMMNGSWTLLLLGNGALALGLTVLLSFVFGVPPFGGPNEMVTVFNSGALLAAVFFGASATLNLVEKTVRVGAPRRVDLSMYAAVVVLLTVIISGVAAGVTPVFFVQGVGATPVRFWVLGSALLLFTYSSVALTIHYLRSKSPILFWYSQALALISIGLLTFFFVGVTGGPISWLGRISLYLGGVYFLASILTAYRGMTKAPNNKRLRGTKE